MKQTDGSVEHIFLDELESILKIALHNVGLDNIGFCLINHNLVMLCSVT